MFLSFSVYDCVSKAVYAIFPLEYSQFWKGETSQQDHLRKVEVLKNEICNEVGIAGSEITVLFASTSEMSVAGHAGRAVVLIPFQKPVVAEDPYCLSYNTRFNCLPSNPAALAQHLRQLGPADLATLIGLQREHLSRLDHDELLFVLGHEIKGHVQHNDNVTFAATAVVATTVSYVALNVLLPDSTIIVPALTVVVAKVVCCVVSRFCEVRADRAAVEGSLNARRGAERFFKGVLVKELAEAELNRKQGSGNTLNDIFGWLESLKYPSTSSRYSRVRVK